MGEFDNPSGDELDEKLKNGDITYSEYQLERIGDGIGSAMSRFEKMARETEIKAADASQKVFPNPACSKCMRPLGAIGGQMIAVYGRGKEEGLPWECQECAGRVCAQCGGLHQILLGKDLIGTDGTIGHQAAFPINPGCTNPSCPKHIKRSI